MKTKNLYILIGALLLSAITWAQAPQKMSYQSVVRNPSGEAVANTIIGVRTIIRQGSATGTTVLIEEHYPRTNAGGIMNLQIGGGSNISGSFASIDWSNGPYFLTIDADTFGGSSYNISGTQQLLSVPYALYAASSGSGSGGTTYTAGSGVQISGSEISAIDNSATNELQNLSLANGRIALSQSQNTIDLTPYLDNTDNQTLSISGNTLSIARGNSITLPASAGGSGYWEPIADGSVDIKNSNTGNVIIGNTESPTSAKMQVNHDAAFGNAMTIKNTNAAYMKVLSVEDNGTSGNPMECVGCGGNAAIKAKSNYGDAIFASSNQRGAYVQGGSDFYPAMKIATNAPGQVALEIDGALKINGGTTGQVLSVNDAGNATWTTPATAPTYTAGDGIQISGNTISAVDTAADNEIQTISKTGNTLNLSKGGGSVSLSNLYNNISSYTCSNKLFLFEDRLNGYVPGLVKTFTLTGNAKVIVNIQVDTYSECPFLAICDPNSFTLTTEIDGNDASMKTIPVQDGRSTHSTQRIFQLGAGTHTIKCKIYTSNRGQIQTFGSEADSTNFSFMDVTIIEE